MLMLAGPPLQGPARGHGRSGADGAEMRYQEREQSSDGDTSEYSGSSSEEGDAPVSVGMERDYTRQRTAAPGLGNMGIEGRATPTPGAGAWKATASQWAARGGPEMQREIGGGGDGGDSGTAEEIDRDGADGGPGGQQDRWQETDNGSGEDNGGAAEDGSDVGGTPVSLWWGHAEEMDRDGADDGGGDRPPSMTKTQRRHWRREQSRKKLYHQMRQAPD